MLKKLISRKEMLKKVKENPKLKLFNGFYDSETGKETLIGNSYQRLSGWALEEVSKNSEYFYEVMGGFATEYIYKKVFNENRPTTASV